MICTLVPCRLGLGGGAQKTRAPRSVLMQLSVWWLVGIGRELGACLLAGGGHHGRPDQAAMESNEQTNQQEMVMVTLELPRDLVDWIDGLKAQMGFRNRGLIVTQLIRELVSELDEENEAPKTSTTV
jgi:hypothetical protein